MSTLPPIRSWLYAPGNNPKLLDRVFTAAADAVILDLEDGVPITEKHRARSLVAAAVRERQAAPHVPLFVRINHPRTGLALDDIRAVVQSGLDGLRLPKVEDRQTVQQIDAWIVDAEIAAGLPTGTIALVCNVESAAGVWHAAAIARASRRILALGFGEADFIRDVNVMMGADRVETLLARSQLVLASRVVGIRSPVDSVYTKLDDDDGLERTTRQGRALGFFGRSAIHPRQVAIINRVYTPSPDEVAWARQVVKAAAAAEAVGAGALRLANGDFVDVAIVRRAKDVLQLAGALELESGG